MKSFTLATALVMTIFAKAQVFTSITADSVGPFPSGTAVDSSSKAPTFPNPTLGSASVPISSCIVLVNATGTFLSGPPYSIPTFANISLSTGLSGSTGSDAAASGASTDPTPTDPPASIAARAESGSPFVTPTEDVRSGGTMVIATENTRGASGIVSPTEDLSSQGFPTSRALTTSVYATVYSTNGKCTTVFPSSVAVSPTSLPICGSSVFPSGTSTASGSVFSNITNTNSTSDFTHSSGVTTKHNMAAVLLGAIAGITMVGL